MKSLTTISRCCCCRQLIPPRIGWTGLQRKIWDRIVTAWYPPTVNDIIADVFADDPDGGPDDPLADITTTIRAMNRKLAYKGLRVRIGSKQTGENGYRLIETSEEFTRRCADSGSRQRAKKLRKAA